MSKAKELLEASLFDEPDMGDFEPNVEGTFTPLQIQPLPGRENYVSIRQSPTDEVVIHWDDMPNLIAHLDNMLKG